MHGYSCLKMSLEYTFAIQTNICEKKHDYISHINLWG